MVQRLDKMYIWAAIKQQRVKQQLKEMWEEERGGTSTIVIEIVMVGMVLALGYAFRETLGSFISSLFTQVTSQAGATNKYNATGSFSNPFGTPQ